MAAMMTPAAMRPSETSSGVCTLGELAIESLLAHGT